LKLRDAAADWIKSNERQLSFFDFADLGGDVFSVSNAKTNDLDRGFGRDCNLVD